MADLDDFFAKKDKKKKGTKKFSQANTDVIAKNLEESAIKEQLQQDKDITNIGEEMNPENVNQQARGQDKQEKGKNESRDVTEHERSDSKHVHSRICEHSKTSHGHKHHSTEKSLTNS